MKSDWKEVLQVFSNLALFVGIILVILEMQQAETIARAQLASESMSNRLEFSLALIGDDPQATLAKACLQPQELTEEDKLQLRRIMRTRVLIFGRAMGIEEIAEFGGDVQLTGRRSFGQIFSVPYLRDLYLTDRDQISEQFHAFADEALSYYADEPDCSIGYRLMNTL